MGKSIITDPDFFKNNKTANPEIKISSSTKEILNKTMNALSKAGLDSYKKDIELLYKEAAQSRFTIAVVGEFSRGKSTFINNMFEKEMLPVANTPTTALLTRIRYNARESITFLNEKGKKTKTLPLSSDSWEGYVADIDGNDPKGVAFVGVDSALLKPGIEIIDTPGAGDLEDSRARLIDDALRGSNGAIITISAESPLSMSEKLFIEERLIAKKTPFLMLIITKLDRIPRAQRRMIIEHIQAKLKLWDVNVPIYIPYDLDMPTDKFDYLIGMDKVTNQISEWFNDPDRQRITEEWIVSKAVAILESAIGFLSEKQLLLECDDSEKAQLIKQKQELLDKAKEAWSSLRNDMSDRILESYDILQEKIDESSSAISERLIYDLSHSSNPQKWWKEDYPYKLKVELTHMSTAIENTLTRKISEDARWFNTQLERSFKAHVLFKPESITDKSIYNNIQTDSVDVGDISKKRVLARIGVSALSMISYIAFASIGIPPIIGSTGISTGGAIVSEGVFKNKIEQQKTTLKAEIERSLPGIIANASSNSKSRIKSIYDNLLNEAKKQELRWLTAQEDSIREATTEHDAVFDEKINTLLSLKEQIEQFSV